MLKEGITNAEYHGSSELGRSTAWSLLQSCPAKVRYDMNNRRPSSPALVLGSAFHTATLEPEKLDEEFAVKPTEIDGKSSRTNHYKEAFEIMQKNEPDKQWLAPADYDLALEMAGSALDNPILKHYMADIDKVVEGTGFFEMEGAKCKVRPDLYNSETGMVLDLKTTIDASPEEFTYSVRKYGYLFQAAFYMTGLRAMGERPKQFVFLVVEKSAPYATACYTLDNADIEREVPRVLEACKIYGECLRTDVWPGYSDDIKTLDLGTYYAKNRLSISQLAEKFGVSRSYAHRIIKKHNVVGQKLGKKRLIDMVEFSTALRWENTKKEVA